MSIMEGGNHFTSTAMPNVMLCTSDTQCPSVNYISIKMSKNKLIFFNKEHTIQHIDARITKCTWNAYCH